jgi:hypothetical protein
MRRENFTGAVQSYRDASKAYATARINAQENMNKSRVEADRAREDMRREKEGARPGPAEYERGLEQERKASDSYDRRDFAGATTQFKAAGDLFAKSKASQQPSSVKPLPPFGSEETAKVRGALDEFKEAIESKDLSRLQRIWPSLTGEQLGRHRDTFDSARRYALELTVQTTRIQGNEAQVRVYRKDTLYAKDGQILRNEGPATFTLKRTQERWMIDRIE